jgi:7-cyano-7-deazaguanine synthase
MANLATKQSIQGNKLNIHTPLINLTKAQIITKGLRLGIDYSITTSCYQANSSCEACGECDACVIRRNGFVEVGIEDPTKYQQNN